jgi:hypothetical protein
MNHLLDIQALPGGGVYCRGWIVPTDIHGSRL